MTVYSDETLALIEADALTEVNKIRVSAGYGPLPFLRLGERSTAIRCPIARSLPLCGSASRLRLMWWEYDKPVSMRQVKTPDSIAKFIELFDDGEFQHLCLSGS